MKKQPNDFIGVNTYLSVQARGLVKRVVSADGSSPSVILNDVSLDIPSAGLTAIVGPSGAGKTSLLYVLSGLDRPDSGRVVIGGTDIYALDEERRSRFIRGHIGFVFQQYNLVPYLTVEENVMLPLSLAHRKADYIRVTQLLSRFGLRRRARTVVSALSGGEQQRVALCRALLLRPAVVIADEPTKGLDEIGSAHVAKALFGYNKQVIFATHDVDMITRPQYAIDRALVVDDHAVVFDGEPAAAAAFYEDLIRSKVAR